MRIGILSEYDENKVQSELSKGATIGIDALSLLDEINLLESTFNYDLAKVLSEIKLNCLVALGKVRPIKSEEQTEKEAKK